MLHRPCILRDPQTKRDNIRSGYLTLAFSGAHKGAVMRPHPYIRMDPQQKGDKRNLANSPLPCWRPKKGRKCYVTPPLSGIPKEEVGQNQKWLPHPCLL